MDDPFQRFQRLPPCVFNIDLKQRARTGGEDIIDFDPGSPEQPTSMFVWAETPEAYRDMASLKFYKKLLTQASVAVSPGVGFGEYGEGCVHFALIENEHRTRPAIHNIKRMMKNDDIAQVTI